MTDDEAGGAPKQHDDHPVAETGGGRVFWWRRPPGRLFHLALCPLAVALLWTVSSPGTPSLTRTLYFTGAVLVLALVWMVRTVAFVVAVIRDRSAGSRLWLVVAPLACLVVTSVLYLRLPLHARWALSKGSFEDKVEAIRPSRYGPSTIDGVGRVGYYDVQEVHLVDGAVVFVTGRADGFMGEDLGGFAYLPDGPIPAIDPDDPTIQSPHFEHLSGHWYAWNAYHDTW